MLNDEKVIDSGTNGNNMEDSRSSATVNHSYDIHYNPLSLPKLILEWYQHQSQRLVSRSGTIP